MGKSKAKTPSSTAPTNRRRPRANPVNLERFDRRCQKLPFAVAIRARRRIYGKSGKNVNVFKQR